MTLDYYKILQINPDANIETIKMAYRRRALECHPDRGGSHEQMVLVNEAWEILSNPITRANYDAARLNVENKEYVRKAESESRNAREQAEQYPRDWNEFETWMDKTINAVITDFKKAEYGETSNWGMGIWPTSGKSFTGWIFIIVGGVLGLLLLYMLTLATVGDKYRPNSMVTRFLFLLFGGGGAFCGRFYHETIKEKLSKRKPLSHSKPDEKSQYNKPTNWKAIAIGVAIVIIFLNIISLISTTPEIPNNSDKYNPPASQTPTFMRPTAAPAPAPAAPLPTNHNGMAPALPNPDFKYNGYVSNGMKKMAIINKALLAF